MSKLTREDLEELIEKLEAARSAVFVAASALDGGDSDLELRSGTALKHASGMLDEVFDDLAALGRQIKLPQREPRELTA